MTSPATSMSSLTSDRDAEQRPLVAGAAAAGGLVGLRERALGEHDADGVQLRVDPLDPLRYSSTSSRGETSPSRTSSAWRAMPAKARSVRVHGGGAYRPVGRPQGRVSPAPASRVEAGRAASPRGAASRSSITAVSANATPVRWSSRAAKSATIAATAAA